MKSRFGPDCVINTTLSVINNYQVLHSGFVVWYIVLNFTYCSVQMGIYLYLLEEVGNLSWILHTIGAGEFPSCPFKFNKIAT